jgi:hypothetical protein
LQRSTRRLVEHSLFRTPPRFIPRDEKFATKKP